MSESSEIEFEGEVRKDMYALVLSNAIITRGFVNEIN